MIGQSITFWMAAGAYTVATALFFFFLVFHREGAARWGAAIAAGGLLPHATSLALRWHEVGHGPFSSRYEVLSANALVLVTLYLAALAVTRGIRGLGAFVMPAALLMLGWAVTAFGVKQEVPIIFRSAWLYIHIAFAKLFGASTLLATACAVAFLLKSRKGGRLRILPPLARLDLYGHQFLLLSFLFLGVMIMAGSLWAHQSWGRYWAWDPIETSSLVTWIVFGIVLHFRVLHRWGGRRMAWLTLVAFAFAMATVYVVILVVPSIHNSYMVGR